MCPQFLRQSTMYKIDKSLVILVQKLSLEVVTIVKLQPSLGIMTLTRKKKFRDQFKLQVVKYSSYTRKASKTYLFLRLVGFRHHLNRHPQDKALFTLERNNLQVD